MAVSTEPFPTAKEAGTVSRPYIHVEVDLHSEAHFFAGLTGCISDGGGVFLPTYRSLHLGDRIVLAISLWGTSINTVGVVRWRTPGGTDLPAGVGVSFEALSDDDQRAIAEFCKVRAPFYFGPW